jgi:hypothetical protein
VREDEHAVKATSVPVVTVEEPQTEADDEVMQEASPISVPTLDEILSEISDYLEDDWQNLASVGIHMSKRCPGFDARIYGYRNFSDLIKKNNGSFELKSELAEDKIHKIMYVKKK